MMLLTDQLSNQQFEQLNNECKGISSLQVANNIGKLEFGDLKKIYSLLQSQEITIITSKDNYSEYINSISSHDNITLKVPRGLPTAKTLSFTIGFPWKLQQELIREATTRDSNIEFIRMIYKKKPVQIAIHVFWKPMQYIKV